MRGADVPSSARGFGVGVVGREDYPGMIATALLSVLLPVPQSELVETSLHSLLGANLWCQQGGGVWGTVDVHTEGPWSEADSESVEVLRFVRSGSADRDFVVGWARDIAPVRSGLLAVISEWSAGVDLDGDGLLQSDTLGLFRPDLPAPAAVAADCRRLHCAAGDLALFEQSETGWTIALDLESRRRVSVGPRPYDSIVDESGAALIVNTPLSRMRTGRPWDHGLVLVDSASLRVLEAPIFATELLGAFGSVAVVEHWTGSPRRPRIEILAVDRIDGTPRCLGHRTKDAGPVFVGGGWCFIPGTTHPQGFESPLRAIHLESGEVHPAPAAGRVIAAEGGRAVLEVDREDGMGWLVWDFAEGKVAAMATDPGRYGWEPALANALLGGTALLDRAGPGEPTKLYRVDGGPAPAACSEGDQLR